MGVGKSTIGRALAQQRSMYFIDLDTYIEKRVAMPISRIFAQFGEDYFRREEYNAVLDLFALDKNIIALGGGTLSHHDLASKIKDNGLLIYLEASSDFLYHRLKDERNTRPLIAKQKKEDLLPFIEAQLEERSYNYQKAQLKLNVEEMSFEEIINSLNNYLDLF